MKRKISPKILKSSLNVLLVIVGIGLIYLCFEGVVLDYFNNTSYRARYLSTSGYFKELKLSSLEHEDIHKELGMPVSSKREKHADNPDVVVVCESYPGVAVQYSEITEWNGALTKYTRCITITGKDYQFGRLKIGIGSPRVLVRFAYLLDQKIDSNELTYSATTFPNVDEGFYGDDWSRILFSYDDAGFVTAIAYEPPSF